MSISQEGLSAKVNSQSVSIFVPATDPLLKLANAINWETVGGIAIPDLMKTKRASGWLEDGFICEFIWAC
jgi:hypothetical protein